MRTQKPRNVTYIPPRTPARERDYQLARLALSGDCHAWDILYEKTIRSVPAAVKSADFRHLFGDWDYQDITDEALTRCYAHLERYRGLSQFQWWVLGYAKNILRNRIQRQLTRRRNQSLLERAAEHHALCQDPLRLLITLERDQFLWEAFYQLTPLDQVIVYQRVFLQTAYATLAKSAQLTRSQVRRRCQDALNAVRWNFLRRYRVRDAAPCVSQAAGYLHGRNMGFILPFNAEKVNCAWGQNVVSWERECRVTPDGTGGRMGGIS